MQGERAGGIELRCRNLKGETAAQRAHKKSLKRVFRKKIRQSGIE